MPDSTFANLPGGALAGASVDVANDKLPISDASVPRSKYITPAQLYTALTQVGALVSVKEPRFGAKGDDSTDDTAAIQAAIDAIGATGGTVLCPPATYRTTAKLTFPVTGVRINLFGYGAVIHADHNGHGVEMISTNENYGPHFIVGLKIKGPNTLLPNAGYVAPSTGAGINMNRDATTNTVTAYNPVLRDVEVEGFKYGLDMQCVIGLNCFGGYFEFNQYGIRIDGGQTNANKFFGTHIRYNRVSGIHSTGRTGGSLTNATQNNFFGCLIESNVEYRADTWSGSGGFNPAFDTTVEQGGVVLLNSYDFQFDGCYIENHNFGVWLGSSSDGNRFQNCYFSVSSVRVGGVMFGDAGCVNNTFENCTYQGASPSPNVKMLGSFDRASAKNVFKDCAGWRFVEAVSDTGGNVSSLYLFNCNTNQASGGDRIALLNLPGTGYKENTSEAATPGNISGMGTGTATLYTYGYGEIKVGNGLSGITTITTFNGLTKNSYFVFKNGQATYALTVAASSDIKLADDRDVTMTASGQLLVFWVDGDGIANEIGRNFPKTFSSTYTPTLANVANVAASTAYACQYFRVGDVVTVTGKVDVDPTTTATQTTLRISLPIASNLATAQQCAGTAASVDLNEAAGIRGDTTNDAALMDWVCVNTANVGFFFTFSYQVL